MFSITEKQKQFLTALSNRREIYQEAIEIAEQSGLSESEFNYIVDKGWIQSNGFAPTGYTIAHPITQQLGLPLYR